MRELFTLSKEMASNVALPLCLNLFALNEHNTLWIFNNETLDVNVMRCGNIKV